MTHPLFNETNSISFLNESGSYILHSSFLNIDVDLRNVARGNSIYKLESALKGNLIEKKKAIEFCDKIGSRLAYIASCLRQIERYQSKNEPIPMSRSNLREIARDFDGISAEECRDQADYYKDLANSYK